MPILKVTDRNGVERAIEGAVGSSVMQVVRDSGLDELLALCGGCCSCATCHIFVDPLFAAALPAMSADEDELLDVTPHRRDTSRLACQIPFNDLLDGLKIAVAPED